ncbi:MAG: ribonuclease T2 family protein [Alkalilacustris sp.]
MRAAWVLVVALGIAGAARAGSGFDHYLLALSWTPGWCEREGAGRGDPSCAPGAGSGWQVHGLWPQHAEGWPEFCTTAAPDPSRGQTRAMADIMGSAGLAWHQWRKHGRCSGLNAQAYFAKTREAFGRVALPEPEVATAEDLAEALMAANPGLEEGQFIVTCSAGRLAEVRVCLTPWLTPRDCGADVLARACRGPLAVDPRP